MNALDANRTEENKDALDSVKEQIKPFFEESRDDDVSLSLADDTGETPKVKEGEVGSYSWIINSIRNGQIIGNVNQKNTLYDEQGRVKSLYAVQEQVTTTGLTSIYYQKFDITYNNDGTVSVIESGMYPSSHIEDMENITNWTKKSESVINLEVQNTSRNAYALFFQ